MDYSEALIAIQQAKDKAAQACRIRDWVEAHHQARQITDAAVQLIGLIENQASKVDVG